MKYYDVCLLDSVASYDGLYTYKSEYSFRKGDVVEVPFGSANLQKSAVICEESQQAEHIKTILSCEPVISISPERLDLILELSDYYLTPRSDMLRLALPKLILKKTRHIFERTGKPVPKNLSEVLKENLARGDDPGGLMCREGYLFCRGVREPFHLSTVLSEDELMHFLEQIPARFHARRKIVAELLSAYPDPIPAHTIPPSSRRFFAEEGSFRYSPDKETYDVTSSLPLTKDQERVFKDITSSSDPLHLIWGVSASGKSHLFLHLAQEALAAFQKVLVLFPDNRVLQASLALYQSHFGSRVGTYQGRMTPSQLTKTWEDWQNGRINVLLATRGALLLPLENLGLILIDECQEDEYLSDHPAYDARKAACLLAKRLNVKTVFASSTPPVELLFEKGMTRHFLRKPFRIYTGPVPISAPLPYEGTLSDEALEAISQNLSNQEKTILLSTRAGYASTVFCRKCGSPRECRICQRPLLYFRSRGELRCQSCALLFDIDTPCSVCGEKEVHFEGRGIEKTEEELLAHFPDAVIERMDYSTTKRSGDFEKWEQTLNEGHFDILLGNKLITRGFEGDFSLAIALDAQATLFLPEHRAGIKTFTRLYQFFARAGRHGPARSILQTRSQDNYVISSLMKGDLWGFYDEEINFRREEGMPPFSSEIMLRFIDKSKEKILLQQAEAATLLSGEFPELSAVSYEPIFAFRRGLHERRILLRFSPQSRPDSLFLLSMTRKFSTLRYLVDPEYILY